MLLPGEGVSLYIHIFTPPRLSSLPLMRADRGLVYLNFDFPVVPDSHLSDLEPSLATDVENVIVPLFSGERTRQFSCESPSKSNSC